MLQGPQIVEMEEDDRGNVLGVTREQALQTLINWHVERIEELDKELNDGEEATTTAG